VLVIALALALANRIPFWQSMTTIMALVTVAVALLLRRAGEPVFKPTWVDTGLGLVLAGLSWGAVAVVLPWASQWVPNLGNGLKLVAGYAAAQPFGWQYAGIIVIATAEELFWRHYVPFLLGGWHGFERYRAQLLSVAPYAALHLASGNVWLALPALAFGTVWGLLTAWRSGPWAAIVWHVVFDFLIFVWRPPV
jgi:membrane protease YdiL (CAAX protease family)